MTCRIKHRCNSLGAILEAHQLGYGGAELDLVWADGDLILNHEHGGAGQQLHWVLDRVPEDFVLAINVKEYGMADELQDILSHHTDYFIFDVPGPELQSYHERGLRYYGRKSEYEVQWSEHGVVVDSFESSIDFALRCLTTGDALISPTLRGLPEWPPEVVQAATFLVTK